MTRIPFHRPAGLAYPEPPQERISVSRRTRRGDGPTTADRDLALALECCMLDASWARTPILESSWTNAGPELGITVISLAESQPVEPTRLDGRAMPDEDGVPSRITVLLKRLAEQDVGQLDPEDVQW
jgi:hypothetical protein